MPFFWHEHWGNGDIPESKGHKKGKSWKGAMHLALERSGGEASGTATSMGPGEAGPSGPDVRREICMEEGGLGAVSSCTAENTKGREEGRKGSGQDRETQGTFWE